LLCSRRDVITEDTANNGSMGMKTFLQSIRGEQFQKAGEISHLVVGVFGLILCFGIAIQLSKKNRATSESTTNRIGFVITNSCIVIYTGTYLSMFTGV
jgi:hypothetical protein